MKHLIAVVLMFPALALACDSNSVNITTFSKHFGLPDNHIEVNEENFGAGYVCNQQGHDYAIGYFKNTFFNDSFYASRHDYIDAGYVNVGIAYGLVTGYPEEKVKLSLGGVSPLVYGTLSKQFGDVKVNIFSTLGYFNKDHVDVVVLGFEVKL